MEGLQRKKAGVVIRKRDGWGWGRKRKRKIFEGLIGEDGEIPSKMKAQEREKKRQTVMVVQLMTIMREAAVLTRRKEAMKAEEGPGGPREEKERQKH